MNHTADQPVEADGGAAALAFRLRAILEPRLRVAAAIAALGAGPAERVTRAVHHLIARGGDRAPGHRAALDAVLLALSDSAGLAYERRAALYQAAVSAGRRAVALVLLESAPLGPGVDQLAATLDQARALTPTGRALTLGERKSLARSHRRDLLLHLVRDPHPDVVAILLANPRLTESDVLRLASRRPMVPASLSRIAASDRWRLRAPIRRALVLNPCTPLPLAARLMTTLADRDLADMAGNAALAPVLRQHAADLLRLRQAA